MKKTASFIKSAKFLSQFKIDDLWAVAAGLSSINYYFSYEYEIDKNIYNSLLRCTNSVFLDYFTKALIHSKAANYKEKAFKGKDLLKVYNYYVQSGNEELPKDFIKNNFGTDGIPFLLTYLSKQRDHIRSDAKDQIALYYKLLVDIPQKKGYKLKTKNPKVYVDVDKIIEFEIGLSPKEYLRICVIINHLYYYHSNFFVRDQIRYIYKNTLNTEDFISEVINLLISSKENYFLPQDYLIGTKVLNHKEINDFVYRCTSSKINLFRLLNRYKFKHGFVSSALNPLEDSPIVKSDNSSLIIPNKYIFDLAIGTSLMHKVSDSLNRQKEEYNIPKNKYFQSLGYLHEEYVYDVISQQLPNNLCIQEKKYKRDNLDFHGPDITLFEDSNITCIEIKRRPVKLELKVSYSPQDIIESLNTEIKVFGKMRDKKLPDIINRPDVYSELTKPIEYYNFDDAIFVLLIGEAILGIQELYYRYAWDKSFGHKCCIMDLISFTKACDFAKVNNISLNKVLNEYFDEASKIGLEGRVSESFSWNIKPNENLYLDSIFYNYLSNDYN